MVIIVYLSIYRQKLLQGDRSMVVKKINKRQENANIRREALIKRAKIAYTMLQSANPEFKEKRVGVGGTPIVIRSSHSFEDKKEYFFGSTDGIPPGKVPLQGVIEHIKQGKRPLPPPEILLILSKNKMGIGRWNARLRKYVGDVIPNFECLKENGWERIDTRNLTYTSFFEKLRINGYLITCCHCGHQFQSKNAKGRYCSSACIRDEETYQRKLQRHYRRNTDEGNLKTRECPVCHEFFFPKTKRSCNCGKGKCRTAWSRQQAKSRDTGGI